MVRRTKTSMFLDCKEMTTVVDVKKMIEGIIKRPPEDQRLFKDEQMLDDNKTLGDCGFTNQTSKAQTPAILGLALRQEGKQLINTLYGIVLINVKIPTLCPCFLYLRKLFT